MKVCELTIKPIGYALAMRLIVAKHYLRRKCPCSFAFGLFNGPDIVGVVCYGTPSSSPLREGICGKEHASNVIELTRLWVDESVGKNGESYLIGNTLRLVDKEIIVSYADTAQGHVGTVYQATNWIYTGLSAKRTNWNVGIEGHSQTIADKYNSKQLKEILGDKFTLTERSRKHRYVFFNCDRRRKKQLLKALKYKIEPYPKSNNATASKYIAIEPPPPLSLFP